MNKVILSGRLTADPELKYSQSGKAICRFTLAVNRPRNREKTDFPIIACFDKTAEAVANYQSKGSLIEVCGVLTTDKYEGKDGKTVYKTEVLADEVNFLGGRKDKPTRNQAPEPDPGDGLDEFASLGREVADEDGIPF